MLVLAALVAAASLLPPEPIQSNSNRVPAGTLRDGVLKDGADLPPALQTVVPARLITGPGETADFEIVAPASAPPGYRIEVKTVLSGWYIPVYLKVMP